MTGFPVEADERLLIACAVGPPLDRASKKLSSIVRRARAGKMIGSPEESHSNCRVTSASILVILEGRTLASFMDDGDDAVGLSFGKVNFIVVVDINDRVNHSVQGLQNMSRAKSGQAETA
jgi:hypothetical protein